MTQTEILEELKKLPTAERLTIIEAASHLIRILQGCYTQGDSYDEALSNIEDAIRLHLEDRLASGEPIPTTEMVSLATLEVGS